MARASAATENASPEPSSSEGAEGEPLHAVIPPVDAEHLAGAVEALVLSCDRPVTAQKLAQALGLEAVGASKAIEQAVAALNDQYRHTGRSFRIEAVAGGYRALTAPEYAPVLAAMHGLRESQNLSRAAIESLAIIAYRQPITRANIEAIRGVASGEVLRSLLDKRLIDITGRAEELGRPMLYGTSRRFLELFGLASIKDLPAATDFAPASEPRPASAKQRSTAARPAPIEPSEDSQAPSDDATEPPSE